MISTLAGHGKDERLIQVELPIVPSVGDRIREDCSNKDLPQLKSLITEGEFIESVEKYGETFWKAKLKNGKFALMAPEDTVIVERAAASVLVEKEICKPLPEQTFKVGDRIKDKDGFIGVITSISAKCITATSDKTIKSYNLTQFKNLNAFIKPCLPTSTISAALEPSALQPETLEKSRPSPILIPAEMRKKSTKRTSLKSRSTQISETIIHPKESICSLAASPAQEPVLQESATDSITPSLISGTSISDVLMKDDQSSQSSKIPQDYSKEHSISEWVKSSRTFPASGIWENGQFWQQDTLDLPKLEKGCLSLPTLTTGIGSMRNAGATSCETWLKDKKHQFIQPTQALSIEMMCLLFGFPIDWVKCLSNATKDRLDEQQPESCLGEQSISIAPQLHLNESSICIEFSANNIDAVLVESDRYQFLLERREQLIESGACPDGVWINCGKVPHRDFKQAVWKSHKPRPEWGDKKSQYIGKFGGDEHLSAIAQHKAGQELRKIEREIKKLQVKS